ncbi:MAG: DUF1669 domain-containing protein [Bacteroidetes bacterium]|nr:MAG: DUF1669 domain-containing protein [Bacteroidota bacterium]
MPNLEELFRDTFSDAVFTRSERQALAKILQEESLSDQELGVLRSKVFDMATDALSEAQDKRVLRWLYEASKVIARQYTSGESYRTEAYFSPGDECLHAIQRCLRQAAHAADICVFTISDDRISREITAAHRRGVRVRIISDNDKQFDKGSDIEQLAAAGIPVRVDQTENHMHHKFAVFDGRLLLSGSYNWTRSAARYNEENILITEDPEAVRPFQREFDRLWEQMVDLK